MTKITGKTEDSRDRLNDPRVKVNMHLSYEDIMGQHAPPVDAPDILRGSPAATFVPTVGNGTRRKPVRRPDQNEMIPR